MMNNSEKELIIINYFNMWIERDFATIDTIFSKTIYYSECYGPEYFSLSEIYLWIDDMLKRQRVLEWNIKKFIHSNNVTIVEWFFKQQQGGEISGFNGVSLIEFDECNKISVIKEYESKAEHTAPYKS